MECHSHVPLIFPYVKMAPLCLLRPCPKPRQTDRFCVRLLSAYGAATRSFGNAFYMLEEEEAGGYCRRFSCTGAEGE